jgi:hypothetical protein
LSRLIAGKPVTCEGWERDRYGRLLGQCSAGEVDLNKEQVAAGWAIAYGGYFDEEDAARTEKLGLWAGDFARPREWRDTHGGMAEGEHDRLGAALNWLRAILGPPERGAFHATASFCCNSSSHPPRKPARRNPVVR